jgi:hypothetical protein
MITRREFMASDGKARFIQVLPLKEGDRIFFVGDGYAPREECNGEGDNLLAVCYVLYEEMGTYHRYLCLMQGLGVLCQNKDGESVVLLDGDYRVVKDKGQVTGDK